MSGDSDIERKLPVWHALSDLFLDTELQPDDYARIAGQLRTSGFSPAEIRRVLETEVAPAFGPNLLSVAGEWTPWSETDVNDIMRRSATGLAPLRGLKQRMFRSYVAQEWEKLRPLLER